MGVSKVEFGGDTIVDLTNDTVTPNSLLNGYSAHNRAGELINGLVVIPTKVSELENDAGYISIPETAQGNRYLRDDGTWVAPSTNLLATEPGIPLDQTMGKQLKDDIDAVNSNLGGLRFYTSLENLGINETTMTYQDFVNFMPVNSILICPVSGNNTFMPSNTAFTFMVVCIGSNISKRITFEAITNTGNADTIYRARYSAPAGTQWTGWKRVEMINA